MSRDEPLISIALAQAVLNAWVTAANNNGNFSEVNDEAVESAVSQYLEAHAPRCNRG